jgi:hypothetical protein
MVTLQVHNEKENSAGTPVYSTNKTDRHDTTEILLKVALITIKDQAYCLNNDKMQW